MVARGTVLERPARLVQVLRLLALYIVRVVVSRGILASRTVRRVLLLCVTVTGVLMSSLSYLFLRQSSGDAEVAVFVFRLMAGSALLWALMSVLAVRVLVQGSPEMMATTTLLPVTARERQHAVNVLEAVLAACVSAAALFSFTTGALLAYGAPVLGEVLACIILPCLSALTVLLILCRLADLAMAAVGIGGMRANAIVLALMLTVVRSWGWVSDYTRRLSASALDGGEEPFTLWPLVFHDLLAVHGVPALLLAAVAATMTGAVLILLVPAPPVPVRPRYYALRLPGRLVALAPSFCYHLAQAARSRFVVDNLMISGAAAVLILALRAPISSVWAAEPVVMGGFFHYANVNPGLLVLLPRQKASWLYAQMVGAQVAVVLPFIVGALLLDAVAGVITPQASAIACASVLSSAVVAVSVGSIMPAHDDNPVSVLLGTATIGVILLLAALMLGIVQLPVVVNVSAALLGWLAVAAVGVMGISYNRKVSHS